MARIARVEYEGAVYHILDRGDRREAILGHVSRVTHYARPAPPELLRKLDRALGK